MQSSILGAKLTRPADTTAYAAGDAVGDATTGAAMTFTPVGGGLNVGGEIKGASCISSQNAGTKPDLQLWLFSAALASNPADNAAFAPTDNDMLNFIGRIDFPTANFKAANAGAAGAGNSACIASVATLPVPGTVYGYLVVQNAYAPISAEVIQVNLNVLRTYGDV
jgi:hypothetical protein